MSVLLCFALKEEAAPFQKIASGKSGISILLTGIGSLNAENSVRDLLAGEASVLTSRSEDVLHNQARLARPLAPPSVIFTCGFAGALNPALAAGDVVFSTDDAELYKRLLAAGAKPAKFLCAAKIATTTAEKQELRRSSGADAVEMESEMIQRLCHEPKIPCAIVRAISDTANENLPLDFNRLSNADLSLNYGRLALAIAKSPGKIPALLRLRRNSRFAAERLANVLSNVIWPP